MIDSTGRYVLSNFKSRIWPWKVQNKRWKGSRKLDGFLSIVYYLFEMVRILLKIKEIKDVKMVLSKAMNYIRFLCEGISNPDYARLNGSFDIFIMSSGLSPYAH